MTTPDGYCAFRNGKLVTGEYSGVIALYRQNWDSAKERNPELDIKPVKILTVEEYEMLKKLEEWTRGLSFRRSN
jgi:hypothetical protein